MYVLYMKLGRKGACHMNPFYARIIGKLLGDGTITKQENRQPRFQFMHRIEDAGWAYYCYDKLKNFIPLQQPMYSKVTDARLQKGYSERCIVQSRTHPLITQLYELWYPNGQKKIPFDFLASFLTAETVAWWYQDDGHLAKSKESIARKIVLSTDSFSKDEREGLQRLLYETFRLHFSIDGQKRLLLYDRLQIEYFLHLVEPWMQPSMVRKQKTASPIKRVAKRTTLHLTSNLLLRTPTRTINEAIQTYNDRIKPNTISFRNGMTQRDENNETTAYQIQLTEENRKHLQRLHAQTGLTYSEIVQRCLEEEQRKQTLPLKRLEQLTTTQQQVIIGSLLGDGSIDSYETKNKGKSCYYREHFSKKQKAYREWKRQKLPSYFKLNDEQTVLSSKVAPLWCQLNELFYKRTEGGRIKIVPTTLLNETKGMTAVATLYMDDGSLMLTHRINHQKKVIYVTPHVALFVQNFTKGELTALKSWIDDITNVSLSLTKRPDGHGFYLRTTKINDTLQFLEAIAPITRTCPSMYYKTNWAYRWQQERKKWADQYPGYQVRVSHPERTKRYTAEEIECIQQMKSEGKTDQQIADALGRTYWAIVNKRSELRKRKKT